MFKLYARLSPFLKKISVNLGLSSGKCRFIPTCSVYAKEVIHLHGPIRGGLLAGKRVLKCHPLHPGGYDPIPSSKPSN